MIPTVIDLLSRMVSINSVNASMAATPGEAEMAHFVADLGRSAGLDVSLQEALPNRPNVFLRLPATERSGDSPRRILFDTHLDTVPIDSMPNALTPRLDGGRMYARGACDTKGAVAAALWALLQLAETQPRRNAEVCLLGSVDEEYQKRGVTFAVANGLRADAAVVGEPTGLRPVIAHKGAVRWKITTHGKAAHTSRPENGVNAIYQMVEVVECLRERLEPALAAQTHPLLTPPTLTVAQVEGGTGANIVPELCTITIDRRTLPTEDPEAILRGVDALLADLTSKRPDVRLERQAPFLAERGLETAPDAAVVQLTQRACAAVLGERADVTPVGVPYGTDATQLGGVAGIPTVVLGPGDIAQAHSADEWVELRQVEQAGQIYLRMMARFVAGDE